MLLTVLVTCLRSPNNIGIKRMASFGWKVKWEVYSLQENIFFVKRLKNILVIFRWHQYPTLLVIIRAHCPIISGKEFCLMGATTSEMKLNTAKLVESKNAYMTFLKALAINNIIINYMNRINYCIIVICVCCRPGFYSHFRSYSHKDRNNSFK